MKKRLLSLLLVLVMVLGMIPSAIFPASAASTVEEALGEIDIYNSGVELDYLCVNGIVKKQPYDYYLYTNSKGEQQEIPVYCVNPTIYGVPETVAPGQSIRYIATEKSKDPKVMGIVANGYPTKTLDEMGVNSKYEAWYATKTALWCYLLSNWDISALSVNPSCSDQAAAQRVLAAVKKAYAGTSWTSNLEPGLTCTPDQPVAYDVTIGGKACKQQVYTAASLTWVCGHDIKVAFSAPGDVPAGTRIVDMDDRDVTSIPTEYIPGQGYTGQFKVLYPADAVEGKSGSVRLSLSADVYQYAIYYAICAETGKYGDLQRYMATTDPTTPIRLNTVSSYSGGPDAPDIPDTPDTPTSAPGSLRIVKQETGTGIPLSGAVFEVVGPHGDSIGIYSTDSSGAIVLPDLEPGNYTVYERSAPKYHLICENDAQNVTVVQSREAKVTFYNDPYGSLRVEKYSDTGEGLEGVTVQIKHIESGMTHSARTGPGGVAVFDELKPGAYEVCETAGIPGWIADTDTIVNVSVVTGQTSAVTLTNRELPGLRIVKYDRTTMEVLPDVVFTVWRDGERLGDFPTNQLGEILLPDLKPGTYVAQEKQSDDDHITVTTAQQVELRAGDGIRELTFFNDRKPGMHLIKVDSADLSRPIANARFRFEAVDGSWGPLEMTTLEDGTIDLSRLPAGAAVVTELECPGYVIDDARRVIELKPNEVAQFVFTNSKKPSLHLLKTSSDGTPLEGVSFRLAKVEDGAHYLDRTTDSAGEILWEDLEPGVYSLVETAAPSDHILSTKEHHIELFPGKVSTIVLENCRRPVIEIIKENAVTFERLSHVPFRVWYASNRTGTGELNDLGVFYTDGNGRIELDGAKLGLRDGWFRVQELEPLKGFAKADPDTQEAFVAAGQGHTFVFRNQPLSAICVWKYDSVQPNMAIEGAVFQIRYLSGNTSGTGGTVIGTYRTQANGSFTVTGLQRGAYIIEERSSDGDHVVDTPPQTVYLSGEGQEVVQVYFGNSPKGALLVSKAGGGGEPLSGVEFLVTRSDGALVGDANGRFTTGPDGTFLVEGIDPGTTLVVKETRQKEGYLLDDTAQTAVVKAGQTVKLQFINHKKGTLVIHKLSSADRRPLEGVQFKLTYADGRVVDAAGGKLSSNGLYWTDPEGQIVLSGITGTVIATEVASIDGFAIDPGTRSQTVVVNPGGDTQHLWFYNDPIGGVEIVKVVEGNEGQRIPNVTFEIRRMDGGLVDTVTTGADGRVFVSLEAGSYYARETKCPSRFKLDSTPHYFEVAAGKTTPTLVVTNKAVSGIVIHKTDSVTGRGIYNVSFLVYDSGHNVIGQVSTDDQGFACVEGLDKGGRYYLRELDNEGYIPDTQLKAVEVKAGESTLVEWKNTPITGQFQIRKYAAEYNEVTGTAAGAPLKGAVYEISEARSGKVVDYITTDARGVAASRPLPLGRYKITEVTAPAYWQLSGATFDETLEYSGQIIKLSDYDKPSNLGVSITKRGNAQVLAGSQMRYDITVANTSNVPLSNFYWHDRIPADAARATVLTTGTYSARLNYRVLYKTNYTTAYQVLASNLLTTSSYSFSLNAIPMQAGEYVTDVYFDFGKVPVGFQSKANPTLTVQVLGTVANNYQIINRADVGGKYQGTWETAQATWLTIVRRLTNPVVPTLPKTGY